MQFRCLIRTFVKEIETSFRKLKYTIGLISYHSYKLKHSKQEILAKLITYNATEILINHCVIGTDWKKKYTYSINFTVAAYLCRIYLRLLTEADSIYVNGTDQKGINLCTKRSTISTAYCCPFQKTEIYDISSSRIPAI